MDMGRSVMIIGDVHKIETAVPLFRDIITSGALYVDKSRFIEQFLLLHGETVTEEVDDQISLERLARRASDAAFYSLLVQAGYLAIQAEGEPTFRGKETYVLTMPNRELELVWQDFMCEKFGVNV
jgi:hypothetical protein